MHNSPVLVTGGAGYIGSHAVLALQDAGRDVVVLDNLSTGTAQAIPHSVPLERGDIADPDTVRAVLRKHGIDSVLHFAGSIRVEESVAEPLKYYHNNTAASRTLIETCIGEGVRRFVFSSTAAVYGIPQTDTVTEESPVRPINPYGWSKLMTEQMLRDAVSARPEMQVAILRYFNVAGADPDRRAGQRSENATHLIKVASEVATGKRAGMQIFGTDYDTPDGTCVRDFIHVLDLAECHLAVLDWMAGRSGITCFNCGYGRGYSVRDIIAGIERAHGKPLSVQEAPRRAGDPPRLIADPTRLTREVGWRPRLDQIDTILATALAWERQLGETAAV
ncbi:MAG: UDP-glucose 4-epimerase GalE [Rhodothalassiaceae bacterium]